MLGININKALVLFQFVVHLANEIVTRATNSSNNVDIIFFFFYIISEHEIILDKVEPPYDNLTLHNYGETWRMEFDVDLNANLSSFQTLIHVEATDYMGAVGHPTLPKIEVMTDPLVDFRVHYYYKNSPPKISTYRLSKYWLKRQMKCHLTMEQAFDRNTGNFLLKFWINEKLFIRRVSKDPQIFGSAIVHFGGGKNGNEVDSSPTMEIKNVKFCNGKFHIIVAKYV